MKSKPIIRAVIFVLTIINIVIYPIGLTLTSPEIVNKVLDTVNFEKMFIDTYKNIITTEVATFGGEEENIKEDIDSMFVKESTLKKQRIENVESFYESISKEEVPEMTFELANPVAKVKDQIQNLPGKIKEVLVTDDMQERCEGKDSFQCNILKSLNLLDEKEEDVIAEGEAEDLIDKLTIKTSLGINENNINRVYNAYRILKYGPEALLVFTVGLMAIGYVFSLPNKKFSKKLIFDFIKADLFALIFWGGIPYLLRAVSPIKLMSEQGVNLTDTINSGIADLFFEVSKRAVLVPFGLTALSILIYVVILMVSRMSKNLEDMADQSAQRYEDIEDEVQSDEPVKTKHPEKSETQGSVSKQTEQSAVDSGTQNAVNEDKGKTVWSSKKQEN